MSKYKDKTENEIKKEVKKEIYNLFLDEVRRLGLAAIDNKDLNIDQLSPRDIAVTTFEFLEEELKIHHHKDK